MSARRPPPTDGLEIALILVFILGALFGYFLATLNAVIIGRL